MTPTRIHKRKLPDQRNTQGTKLSELFTNLCSKTRKGKVQAKFSERVA